MHDGVLDNEAESIVATACYGLSLPPNVSIHKADGLTELVIQTTDGDATLTLRPHKLAINILKEFREICTDYYKDQEGEECSEFNLYLDIVSASREKLESVLSTLIRELNLDRTIKSNINKGTTGYAKLVEKTHKEITDAEECLLFYRKVIAIYPFWRELSKFIRGAYKYSLAEIRDKAEYEQVINISTVKQEQLDEIIQEALNNEFPGNREYSPQGLAFKHACEELEWDARGYEHWKKMYQKGEKRYQGLKVLGWEAD